MRHTWLSILMIIAFGCFLLTFGGCTDKIGNIDPDDIIVPEDEEEEEEEEEPVKVWEVSIETGHDVLQGHYYDLDITADLDSIPFGGFDLLIGYDAAALAFTEAAISEYLNSCGWEYFTYRYGAPPGLYFSGLVRIVGVAETNNGGIHPDYDCIGGIIPLPIATITFFVSNDRQYECTFQPVAFYWGDCGDNAISTIDGDTLALNRYIYDYDGSEIQDSTYGFPGPYGVPNSPCFDGGDETSIRYIDFYNGGLDLVCSDPIDPRGDLNVNGLANEIADAVIFSNYFINGTAAFNGHVAASTAASDVNYDGIELSVADFVYLIRIIVGDAIPYDNLVYPPEIAQVFLQNGNISIDAPHDLGAGLFVFNFTGELGVPELMFGARDMDIKYGVDGNELRVLVYNIGQDYIASGYSRIFTITHTGDLNLIAAELATYEGTPIQPSIQNLVSP